MLNNEFPGGGHSDPPLVRYVVKNTLVGRGLKLKIGHGQNSTGEIRFNLIGMLDFLLCITIGDWCFQVHQTETATRIS